MIVRWKRSGLACLLLAFLFAMPCWAEADPAIKAWHRKLIEQMRTHLQVPQGFSDRYWEAWVDFAIDRAGRITEMKLVRSTGAAELDAAALAAIEAAQPFPLPPNGDDNLLKIPVVVAFPGSFDTEMARSEAKIKAQLRGICRGC